MTDTEKKYGKQNGSQYTGKQRIEYLTFTRTLMFTSLKSRGNNQNGKIYNGYTEQEPEEDRFQTDAVTNVQKCGGDTENDT